MSAGEFNIEKLNVDIYAANQHNPQQFLHQIITELKENVLPKLEADLKISNKNRAPSDVFLDRLDIDLMWTPDQNWHSVLSEKIVQHIVAVYNEKQHKPHSFSASDKALDLTNAWLQIRFFYQWGHFPLSEGYYAINSLQKWENEVSKSNFYAQILEKTRIFIQSERGQLKRMLNQHSFAYISGFISQLFPKAESDFLVQCLTLNTNGYQFASAVLDNCFSSDKVAVTNFSSILVQLIQNGAIANDFFHHLISEDPTFYKEHQKIIDGILTIPQNQYDLSRLIKAQSTPELYIFIQYLRSDTQVQEKLDPLLQHYFFSVTDEQNLNHWMGNFAKFIPHVKTLSNLLLELEDIQPLNGEIEKPAYFAKAFKAFIAELENRHKELLTQVGHKNPLENQDEQFEKNQPSIIAAPNAGLVLLNPFLPTLFKNLGLHTEKGNWVSPLHQSVAIYVLNYLATQTFDTTEDQLQLAKLLAGFPLTEPLENWEVVCNQLPENHPETELVNKLTQVELPNLLEIIHENWYPMRNCTWAGLQNDFLTRPGRLELKENKHHKLTPEPHALDVLLPHIKWGISMIKYSWMEDVLLVEWP